MCKRGRPRTAIPAGAAPDGAPKAPGAPAQQAFAASRLRAAGLGPFGAGLALVMRNEPGRMARGWQPIARPVLTGLIVGHGFAKPASRPFELFGWFDDSRAATQNWLAEWPVLSALAVLGGIAAALALRSRALIPRSLMQGDCMALRFAESTARRYTAARYPEFRVDRKTSEAVLVGLRDAGLQPT